MNYNEKVIAITGLRGFLGHALALRLQQLGARIIPILGDVRDPETFKDLSHEFDYLFHFADPSSQVLFKRQPLYAAETTILGFLNAAKYCRRFGIKLVYPSTGLLSQERENEYARCKKVCEDIHLGEGLDALGIRIFATYGPGEGHKRDYASVPYLFAQRMARGLSPEIYGDGEQTRDFIYISDVVEAIAVLAEECNDQVIDVGSGEPISFNTLVFAINEALGTKVSPVYIDRPVGYVHETLAKTGPLQRFYTPKIGLKAGIEHIIQSLPLEHLSTSKTPHD